MAGRGPAPSGMRSRERDQRRDEAAVVVIAADDVLRGPDLPDTHEWPQQTRDWWDTWRKAPQAQTFTDTDWSFLLDTAVLHGEYWLGDRSVAAELRLRVAKFGATPEDRARLKMSIGEAKTPPPARLQTRATKDRRGRLLKAVGDEG
jgi:hypothetical protein